MQKVLILGCPGAGKSTFARRLHASPGCRLQRLAAQAAAGGKDPV